MIIFITCTRNLAPEKIGGGGYLVWPIIVQLNGRKDLNKVCNEVVGLFKVESEDGLYITALTKMIQHHHTQSQCHPNQVTYGGWYSRVLNVLIMYNKTNYSNTIMYISTRIM